jgi:hypothetical protein
MAGVEGPDPAGEVDQDVPIDVDQEGPFRPLGEEGRRMGDPAGHGGAPARQESGRTGAG